VLRPGDPVAWAGNLIFAAIAATLLVLTRQRMSRETPPFCANRDVEILKVATEKGLADIRKDSPVEARHS
jgi:hypothetical protein